ncbi:MAG: TlpA disulfide reductase family protein [Dehalococcoidia bacterium]|jgi:peroxiredoxin
MKLKWVLIDTTIIVIAAAIAAMNLACNIGGTTAKPPTPAVANSGENKTPAVSTDNDTASNVSGSTTQSPVVSTVTEQPLITDVEYVASASSVSISWKTNKDATSFLKYGTDLSLPFPSSTAEQMSTQHSIFLNGLAPSTRYHYKIFSTDAAGNTGTTGDDMTFTTAPSNSSPYMGNVAPDFALNSLQNNKILLSQYRGKKVILNFWETWCGACQMELPTIQAVSSKYSGSSDVALLTVAGGASDTDAMKTFMTQNNIDFTVCPDESGGVFNIYGITSTPRTFFLDKNGVIRKIQQDLFTSASQVEVMLDSY